MPPSKNSAKPGYSDVPSAQGVALLKQAKALGKE
jgi:hypothetical protein